MINVKEEKTPRNVATPSLSMEAPGALEVKKNPSATVVNLWIRSFKKWLDILTTWKGEANLIDRLIALSLLGEDQSGSPLNLHHDQLRKLINSEIRNLETEILDMQQNIDLLQRYVINTDVRVKEIKLRMQKLSETYTDLKLKIFHDLARVYPLQII